MKLEGRNIFEMIGSVLSLRGKGFVVVPLSIRSDEGFFAEGFNSREGKLTYREGNHEMEISAEALAGSTALYGEQNYRNWTLLALNNSGLKKSRLIHDFSKLEGNKYITAPATRPARTGPPASHPMVFRASRIPMITTANATRMNAIRSLPFHHLPSYSKAASKEFYE